MKVIESGHLYALKNYGLEQLPFLLRIARFEAVRMEDNLDDNLDPVEQWYYKVADTGVIVTDVIKALVEHMEERQAAFPNRVTAIAITKLQEAGMWLRKPEENEEE